MSVVDNCETMPYAENYHISVCDDHCRGIFSQLNEI